MTNISEFNIGIQMKTINTLALIVSTITLLACGPDNKPQPKLLEAERNTLDKAKAMDKKIQQQTQEQQQSVDKQTQ